MRGLRERYFTTNQLLLSTLAGTGFSSTLSSIFCSRTPFHSGPRVTYTLFHTLRNIIYHSPPIHEHRLHNNSQHLLLRHHSIHKPSDSHLPQSVEDGKVEHTMDSPEPHHRALFDCGRMID